MATRVSGGTSSTMWTRWIDLIAGVLLFIAPWVLGYAGNSPANWSSWVLGALIAIFAIIGLFSEAAGTWTQWICGICGILAFIAPWVLGYTNISNAFYASLVLGAIAVIFAAIGIFVRPAAAV